MSITTVVVETPVVTVVTVPSQVTVEVVPNVSTLIVDNPVMTVLTVGQQGPQGPAGASGAAVFTITLEAGENLVVGNPVWVNANKLYIADNITNFRVVGIVTTAALIGLPAVATTAGQVTLSGLTPNSPYFLGGGIITAIASASGYIIRMGQAVSSTALILNIEEPILLS